ncbi:MAG TPA: 16S rRNA (guanine(966)-N(2))-methyltransferase RsmD [Chthoniobacterales bacterium]|jgi:16S rRNA (guanine966-N2)-methyltransferase
MRVVAGLAGGIPLQIPKHDLRPTMDKVKGAIFSSLGEVVVGARVLDLFAGSGGLGIEAMSRGAAQLTMVESNAKALEAISANLRKTRMEGTVCREDVFHFLKRNTAMFDLIFADPPYAKTAGAVDYCDQLWHSQELARALAPDGFFILERAPGADVPATSFFQLVRQKRYGASEVLLLRLAGSLDEET